MIDAPPPRIKGFRIGEPLSRGGFSVVWTASRLHDDAPCAVKVGIGNTLNLCARFRREADVLQRIGPPHVPALYASGQLEEGHPWIAMERLFGRTLAEEIASRAGAPDLEQGMRRADALLLALSAAHALGFVHRDLKPDNVFIPASGTGAVVLLDFGLAKETVSTSAELTHAGTIVGTPHYMAPEQIRGDRRIDARADIYAFGVILFELLTSRQPFVGDTGAVEHGHLALRPPRPSQFGPVPPALDDIVLACLAKEPSRRPEGVVELRRSLARALEEVRPSEGRCPTPPPAEGAKILGDGRQPVVLLLAETRAPMPAVVAALSHGKGFVARQRGSRYLSVFSSREADHPALAALAAAQEIVRRFNGRAALHLSSVAIRRRDRGPPLVSGPDVEHPEAWAPPEPWSGLVIGIEVGRLLPENEPTATWRIDRTGTLAPVSIGAATPLFGRAVVSATLERSAALALESGRPSLFTALGETGLGKSRVALEAARIARLRRQDARIVVMRAEEPGAGTALETAALLRTVLDAPETAPVDVEAFCRESLGAAVAAETWPAIAAALGWQSAALDAPLRHGLTRALAEGLRRCGKRGALAVILDDAHRADDVLLDALEAATLDGEDIALWVALTAHPRLSLLRPRWGARTLNFVKVTLAPLDEAPAAELAAELLRPAEYPPLATLTMLARWSGGNPGCLQEIVRALKGAGVVRRRSHAESYYVATAELEKLPASPAWQWLAVRSLDALPPDIAACARLCALLGASFTRTELEWVQDAIEREGQAGTPVDAGFGLETLVERRILHRIEGERYAFETRMIRDAVVEMLDPAHRSAIHRHALAYWRARAPAERATPEDLEPLAAHAGACGAWEDAVDAYLRLGDGALQRNRHVEADHHYTAALGVDAGARRRTHALLGRGRCRYRLHRPLEAVEDLAAARASAAALEDDLLLAEILLEEATALCWAEDFTASEQRVEQAAALVTPLSPPRLRARLLVGQGRTHMRNGQMAEAAELLSRAVQGEGAAMDVDTQVVALLLLPVALVFSGQMAEAEIRFQEAIDLAARIEDGSHLCMAYINRCHLWATKKDLPRALEDMFRAVPLAREIGNPFLEQLGTLNVAELLHWEGRHEEALALTRRAKVLDERFLERPAVESSLVMARVLVALDAFEEAAPLVDWIAAACLPGQFAVSKRALFRMLQAVLGELAIALEHPPSDAWEDIVRDARGNLLEMEMLELLYWRARMAIGAGRPAEADEALREAGPILDAFPAWRPRFDALRKPPSSAG